MDERREARLLFHPSSSLQVRSILAIDSFQLLRRDTAWRPTQGRYLSYGYAALSLLGWDFFIDANPHDLVLSYGMVSAH